jgi:hypothetical protein
VIRVYDEAGNVIETHEHTRDFQEAPALASNGVTKAFRDLTIETLLVAT